MLNDKSQLTAEKLQQRPGRRKNVEVTKNGNFQDFFLKAGLLLLTNDAMIKKN